MPARPLPSLARAQLERELRRDETVLWAAQPIRFLRLRRAAAPLALGLLCVIFAVAVEPMAVAGMRSGADDFDVAVRLLLPLPFGFVGLQVVVSVLGHVRATGRSVTALTDHRLIHLTWGAERTVSSWNLGAIVRMSRRQRADGAGDLTVTFRDDTRAMENPTAQLFAVPDVEELEHLVTKEVSRYRDPMLGPH